MLILSVVHQDHDHLYLVMEYLPGGDLLGLMCRHGAFDEDTARFYLAELTQALHALHQQGFVHRDIKPENILLDRFGHLKLADFGNAAPLSRTGTVVSMTPVGTPDYIAPELLDTLSTAAATHSTRSVHDATCDFWSMGIIGYEFLTEETPFHADSVTETYALIDKHVSGDGAVPALKYPGELEVTRDFRSLIDALVTRKSKRLTYTQILQHSFFQDVEWDHLRLQVPPIIPSLSGEDDTSNFEDVDKQGGRRSGFAKLDSGGGGGFSRGNDFSGQNLPFLGYSFVHEDGEDSALGSSVDSPLKTLRISGKEAGLMRQCSDLQKKVALQTKDIKTLQTDLLEAQHQAAGKKAAEKILVSAKAELEINKAELKKTVVELAACRLDVKTLRSSLQIVEEARVKRDANIAEVVSSTYKKWENIKRAGDKCYENQLHKKATEIAGLADKLTVCEQELGAKGVECTNLQERVHKYKELLRTSKSQHSTEKLESDQSKQQLSVAFEQKIRELKQKLQHEREAKQAAVDELNTVRRDLDESVCSTQSMEQLRRTADKNTDEIKGRLNAQILENREIREQNAQAGRMVTELEQRLESNLMELTRLKHEHQKQAKELQAKDLVAKQSAAAISRRSSGGASDLFRSAQGSLESISSAVEEQLRSDLSVAKENEFAQRQRADDLADAVARMEEAIGKLQPKPQDALLEKQNSKLEDQLASVREQAIVERQASRTAHLSLYKLEKQLEDLNEEKKRTARRIELSEERFSKLRLEKEDVERQLRDQTNALRAKQERIEELLAQCRDHKQDVRKEHAMWEKSEHERMRDKSEILEHVSKVHQLEERCTELRRQLAQTQARHDAVTLEHKRVAAERDDERNERCAADEHVARLETELHSVQRNYEILKHTCTIMETQLNELEAMHETESTQNRAQIEKSDSLWSTVRARNEDVAVLRVQLDAETAKKLVLESRCAELQNQLQEEQDGRTAQHLELINTQEQLVTQQSMVFETQESVELLSADMANMQRLNQNFVHELHILKEENSRILTDLYRAKEDANRLEQERQAALTEGAALRNEREQLKGTLSEQLAHYSKREHKAETTRAQLQKLVEYLQHKINDMSQKKKKTLATVLFGTGSSSARKENVMPAMMMMPGSGDETAALKRVQDDLRRERQRNAHLKEQLIQAKTDIQSAASVATVATPTTKLAAIVNEPSAPSVDEIYEFEMPAVISPRRQATESAGPEQAHRFEMTLEMQASNDNDLPYTPCIVCGKEISVGRSYMRCKGSCKSAVHRRCRDIVLSTCEEEERRRMQHVQVDRGIGVDVHSDELDDAVAAALDDGVAATGVTDSDNDLIVQHEYVGDVVLRSADLSPPVSINCVYEVKEGVLLLGELNILKNNICILLTVPYSIGQFPAGSESGLYSYNTVTRQLVHIPPVTGITHIAPCVPLSKCLFIGDNGKQLFVTELRHLHSRAEATACLRPKLDVKTIELPFANRVPTERWHHVSINVPPANSRDGSDAHVIACTASRLVILRYDVAHSRFNPVCALDTARPVTCVLYTTYATAIVSSDKFFEIDLKTFQAEEFLDESDSSCSEARNECRPHSVFKVNSQEFLLCFAEFGVFVDTYGDRSRPDNVSWSSTPVAFVYREPLLFVAYRSAVDVLRINKSYSSDVSAKLMRSSVAMAEPRLVGDSGAHGAFVLRSACGSAGGQVGGELLTLDGIRSLKTAQMASNSTETLLSSVAGGGAGGRAGSTETLSTIRDSEASP